MFNRHERSDSIQSSHRSAGYANRPGIGKCHPHTSWPRRDRWLIDIAPELCEQRKSLACIHAQQNDDLIRIGIEICHEQVAEGVECDARITAGGRKAVFVVSDEPMRPTRAAVTAGC